MQRDSHDLAGAADARAGALDPIADKWLITTFSLEGPSWRYLSVRAGSSPRWNEGDFFGELFAGGN